MAALLKACMAERDELTVKMQALETDLVNLKADCEHLQSTFHLNDPVESAKLSLDSEAKEALLNARDLAMRYTLHTRIPECGYFGAIAQDLDYVCHQFGIYK